MKPTELEVCYGEITKLSVTNFIRKDMVHFSLADLHRSIAHVVDGWKPSQRKIMYACFKRKLTKEMKVAQLGSHAADVTAYHHGETSLGDTIVKLAHTFVGSNNVNFLEPKGQFGTRLMGGKDSSQTRYINTHLTPLARCYFDPKDDPVLIQLEEDNKIIEPEFFVPVLPTVLINGTEGIGTGFSTYIPPFNPLDVKDNISRILNCEDIKPMVPYFNGFKGTITPDPESNQIWIATGVWKTVGHGRIMITELPPGRWTNDFKEHLDEMVEKKKISEYINNSTTEDVKFEVFDYSGKNFSKDFGMTKNIRATNMHLFHPSGIKKYNTPEEILVDFVEIRLEYYKKRKINLVKELSEREIEIRNKAEFVRQVVNDEFIIFKRKKMDIENELERKKFDKINEKYDYLLNIKTHQYTEEEIDKLENECNNITEELKILKSISHTTMWKTDVLKC
jgi:DNA topoisomerase-2